MSKRRTRATPVEAAPPPAPSVPGEEEAAQPAEAPAEVPQEVQAEAPAEAAPTSPGPAPAVAEPEPDTDPLVAQAQAQPQMPDPAPPAPEPVPNPPATAEMTVSSPPPVPPVSDGLPAGWDDTVSDPMAWPHVGPTPETSSRESSLTMNADLSAPSFIDTGEGSLYEFRLELADERVPHRPRIAVFDTTQPDPTERTGWKRVITIDLPNMQELASDLCITQMKANQRLDMSAWVSRAKQIRKQIGFLNPTANVVAPACVGRDFVPPGLTSQVLPEKAELIGKIVAMRTQLADDEEYFSMVFFDQKLPGLLTREEMDNVMHSYTVPVLTSIHTQMEALIDVRQRDKIQDPSLARHVAENQGAPVEAGRHAAAASGVGIAP